MKTSPKDKRTEVPKNPNAAWEKDAGFKYQTTNDFIDTPGVETAKQGFSITKTAYYAVGIVCRSKAGKRVSPLLSSFVYSVEVTHNWTGANTGKAEFKIPDGEFPSNWARLLGVTVDEKLHCGC